MRHTDGSIQLVVQHLQYRHNVLIIGLNIADEGYGKRPRATIAQ